MKSVLDDFLFHDDLPVFFLFFASAQSGGKQASLYEYENLSYPICKYTSHAVNKDIMFDVDDEEINAGEY